MLEDILTRSDRTANSVNAALLASPFSSPSADDFVGADDLLPEYLRSSDARDRSGKIDTETDEALMRAQHG